MSKKLFLCLFFGLLLGFSMLGCSLPEDGDSDDGPEVVQANIFQNGGSYDYRVFSPTGNLDGFTQMEYDVDSLHFGESVIVADITYFDTNLNETNVGRFIYKIDDGDVYLDSSGLGDYIKWVDYPLYVGKDWDALDGQVEFEVTDMVTLTIEGQDYETAVLEVRAGDLKEIYYYATNTYVRFISTGGYIYNWTPSLNVNVTNSSFTVSEFTSSLGVPHQQMGIRAMIKANSL